MNGVNISVLLAPFLPLLIGWLTRLIMEGLKKASGAIDELVPWAKQIIVAVIAVVLNLLPLWLGVDLAGATKIEELSASGISAVLSALFAMITHQAARLSDMRYGTSEDKSLLRHPGRHRPSRTGRPSGPRLTLMKKG